ncbi:DUF4254 domain-containing protein [Nocardia sp. NBC_01503]|uniref:DUF4254 domain-containing protein n=1 Tax=Nocardia sp. NBC_01503 TaxID=2975997 RepID=UPI002E7BA041|nr:DUF4254 domain-containing protein [Nocardia sp. NBC_01503]WTL33315.1 DUF4254 domain-containing protein [Nocardia sp. NBC_01503]
MATEYTGTGYGAELPSPTTLLRAFREPVATLLSDPAADPRLREVLEAAHDLVQCHERRHRAQEAAHAAGATPRRVTDCVQTVEEIDARRTELVARIDEWVAINIPHRTGASLHTETLGAVIDRMAAKWVAAQQALGVPPPDTAPRLKLTEGRGRRRGSPHLGEPPRRADSEAHLQWYRLAELADGYRDLITEVAQHRRRLPVW